MKITELRNLSKEELLLKEKTLKDELFKLNQQRYAGRVEKPHLFSILKRDIARINTLLNAGKQKLEPKKVNLGENQKKEEFYGQA